jgi:hypothetical protein
MAVSEKDRRILRDLARRAAEIAARPEEKEKAELWRRSNRLEPLRPMVYVSPAPNIWLEFLPDEALETLDPWARGQERQLRQAIYHADHFHDDRVFDDEWPSPIAVRDTGFGIRENSVRPDHPFGSRHFNTVLESDEDLDLIQEPRVSVDPEATERTYERLADVFGDILRVEKRGRHRAAFTVMDQLFTWRGMEQMFIDLVDRPAWVHEAMERLTRGFLSRLDQMEALNVLALNNRNQRSTSGGIDCTDQLPADDFDGLHVRTRDMWGHATTQIFSDVSPDMHDEFTMTYERRYMERFGLCNYGCCEPLHKKTHLMRTLPNLRRVSMSPWVDAAEGAAGLGRDYIFSYKPNPAVLGAEQWSPETARAEMRDVLEKTRGCAVELVMKDLHTCREEPRRIAEWCSIAGELAEQFAE